MRRYLLASLLISFLAPVRADENCFFISQYEPDVTIEVSTIATSSTKGYINYKGSPVFQFSTGIRNGYVGQYFSIGSISNSLTDQPEILVSGSVITVVGDQSGTGTPIKERKQGLNKVFFPNFGLNYYYSLTEDANRSYFGDKSRTRKINSILMAAEGFWIPSEVCKKYVPYSW